MIDFVAIGFRALAFAAVLQAAGAPLFLWLFDRHLDRAAKPIGALAVNAAVAGILLTLGHTAVEPARFAGEFRGILDLSLHGILLSSDAGTAVAIRLLGLAMVAAGCIKSGRFGAATALIGSTLIVASFAFMGHTATADHRWLLAALLIVHLLIISFWFGALWPLLIATQREAAALIAALVEQFSKLAIWLVPMIFFAGLALAIALLPAITSLGTPYGVLLLIKIAAFTILMGLAAMNKWRLAPRIGGGDDGALRVLQRSVLAEWLLIVGVVSVTAAMTGLFSPRPLASRMRPAAHFVYGHRGRLQFLSLPQTRAHTRRSPQGGKMGSTLNVGNLSTSVTDDDLLMKFGDHGVVQSAMVTRDTLTGMSRRIGCVVMENEEEAQAAIDWLHLSQFEGRTISVTRAVTH